MYYVLQSLKQELPKVSPDATVLDTDPISIIIVSISHVLLEKKKKGHFILRSSARYY